MPDSHAHAHRPHNSTERRCRFVNPRENWYKREEEWNKVNVRWEAELVVLDSYYRSVVDMSEDF